MSSEIASARRDQATDKRRRRCRSSIWSGFSGSIHERVKIAMDSVARAFGGGECSAEALAAIFADRQEKSGLVNAIGVLGISGQPRKIERASADIERVVGFSPTIASIVGAEERGVIPGLDHRIDAAVIAGSNCDANAPQIAFGQAFSQFVPGGAGVGALE